MPELRRIWPLDPVSLEDPRLGAGGPPGEVRLPPWPSDLARALRRRMRLEGGEPATLRVTALGLLGPRPSPKEETLRATDDLVTYFPLPGDLLALPGERTSGAAERAVHPVPLLPASRQHEFPGVTGSFPLPATPVARSPGGTRPLGGMWITGGALSRWLRGQLPARFELVPSTALWARETRHHATPGPSLPADLDAPLPVREVAALHQDLGVSFLVACEADAPLPAHGRLLTLGHRGQGASVEEWTPSPGTELPWQVRPAGDRFRLMLATPGIFPGGWMLPGTRRQGEGWRFSFRGMEAELVAASFGRPVLVEGWDEDHQRPAPARRAVPQGAVYWLERRAGDLGVLDELVAEGLGPLAEQDLEDEDARRKARRYAAEGFNQVWVGSWAEPAPPSMES